jgi:hypothetical protein
MRSALSSSASLQDISGTNIELFVTLGLIVLIFAGFWKTFEKVGKPGWAGIIPIYNLYVLVKNKRKRMVVVCSVFHSGD